MARVSERGEIKGDRLSLRFRQIRVFIVFSKKSRILEI